MRETARHGTTVIYDAVQVDLERRVSLTVLGPGDPRAERFRADAWPEHPHIVSLYAAGPSELGFFIATRLVPGATTLRRRIAAGADPAPWLADVRATLAATGAVHGALDDEWSLLVDREGHVRITGFGLAAAGAPAADDAGALARLERLAANRASGRAARRRRPLAASVLVTAAAATPLLIVLSRDDGGRSAEVAAPAAGAVALGSALAAGPVRSRDCEGQPPSGRSPDCTVVQSALPGRTLAAARDGVIVAWHVRGARGDVALRVIRRRGNGTFARVGGTDVETVDAGLHSFRAAVPVRRGERVGLDLAPGAVAGFRPAVQGAATARFIDALWYEPRPPNPPTALDRDQELLLRVDYVPGRTIPAPERVEGAAAAAAPAGRRLDELELDVADDRTVTAAVVALPDGVAVDVFGGTRRRARIAVPGADPRGRPVTFTAKGEPDLSLAWRNPSGALIETRYRVTPRSIAALR